MSWRRCSRCGDWAECELTRCRQCETERAKERRGLPVVPLFPDLPPEPGKPGQEDLDL